VTQIIAGASEGEKDDARNRASVCGEEWEGMCSKVSWQNEKDELEAAVDCDNGVLRLYVECFVFCLGCKAERRLANLQI
jgi:hypothetical protein